MRNITNKAFTLVELLVVITILAIMSVVAYQNFGGAVDKAVSGRKVNDVSTIEGALQQFKVDKNYYPKVDKQSPTNLWGYTGSIAMPSNKIIVQLNGEQIKNLTGTIDGGGRVYATGAFGQIGAKGTISRETLGKRYLSKDLFDPEVGDLKIEESVDDKAGKLIDFGIGRYVYAVYKKPKKTDSNYSWSTQNKSGSSYNLAYTIKVTGSDNYKTKIVGDYDEESCYDDYKHLCPTSLIGTLSGATDEADNVVLIDGEEEDGDSNLVNYHIPYASNDFFTID